MIRIRHAGTVGKHLMQFTCDHMACITWLRVHFHMELSVLPDFLSKRMKSYPVDIGCF